VHAHLGRCSVFSMLQRQSHSVCASLAPEGHPGAHGSDVAHSDHCSLHTNQPSEHACTQHPQRRHRLVVIQPVDDVHKWTLRHSWSGKQLTTPDWGHYLALMWGILMNGVETGSSTSCSSAACFSKSVVNTWITHTHTHLLVWYTGEWWHRLHLSSLILRFTKFI